jgi:hypothetical protein
MGTFLIIIGMIGVITIIASAAKPQKRKNRANLYADTERALKAAKVVTGNNNSMRYNSQRIQGRIVQTLETIRLIENSKNPDIVVGRYGFLKELINGTDKSEGLKYYQQYENYTSCMQNGLESYKKAYYDVIPTQTQLSMIAWPQKADIEVLFKKSMTRVINDYYRDQSNTIKTLKRQDAIEKRKNSIIEKCQYVKKHLSECTNKSGLDAIYAYIDNIINLVQNNNFDETFNIEFTVVNK